MSFKAGAQGINTKGKTKGKNLGDSGPVVGIQSGKSKKLSPEKKAKAKAMAKSAGRPYPNLVDNMRAAKG
jgi:hypothetical protein